MPPILSALLRNKVGATLIALQMAVTLGILCNAIFIVQQRVAKIQRPSGVDEIDDFTLSNEWIGRPADLAARIRGDVDALRAIPAVADAFDSDATPLNDAATTWGITLHPDDAHFLRLAAVYTGDDHTTHTLGYSLIAGHDFDAAAISDYDGNSGFDRPPTSGILVTRALAKALSPDGNVLGRVATLFPLGIHAPIVGVIATLQAPFVNAAANVQFVENSIVVPYRLARSQVFYIIRAKPGQLADAMRDAPRTLLRISNQRVIQRVWSFQEGRRELYRGDRTMALLLTLVCVVLLAVTAFGIIGLTSYWVAQRRRQIGIRRALGATRMAIVNYFQTENLLISLGGILVGVALTLVGNIWMVKSFAMSRLPYNYPLIGVLAMLVLGQLAVLWPAVRAASVAPALATRTG